MGDLTANFDRKDFTCHCDKCKDTGPICIPDLVSLIQSLRNYLQVPLKINAGVRCADHNKLLGGAPDSRHLPDYADAVDVELSDSVLRAKSIFFLISTANEIFIEVCPQHLHFDLRPGPKKLILGADK